MPRKRQNVADPEPVLISRAAKALLRTVKAVAGKDVTLTLLGESGVGKEVVARLAHDMSTRCHAPFVAINCAAIPDALFESELFGHERGAFTGASRQARGKLEAASGGTLLLDEIGELPLSLQPKLLRFLEHRRFMRVGGSHKVDVDVRLMFATLRPLEDEVRAGRFRADLFYRVQGITLHVPPLRERRADIAPLLAKYIAFYARVHGVEPPRIDRGARARLLAYPWPGNVRELRNAVESICLLRAGRTVRRQDLPEPVRRSEGPREIGAADAGTTLQITLADPLAKTVARVVKAVLEQQRGDKAAAAASLGLSLRTLQRYAERGAL